MSHWNAVCQKTIHFARMSIGLFLLATLCGCYTRQIEGLQKDFNTLDRKLHTLNQKNKESMSAKAPGNQAGVLQFEDRLNELTLKQSDLQEEVGGLRQNYADIKTSPAGGGGSIDKNRMNTLEKQVQENNRKTAAMQRDVDYLRSTFESMRSETKTLIQLLKEEFGEGGGAAEATTKTSKATSTTVEDPPTTVAQSPGEISTEKTSKTSPSTRNEERSLVASNDSKTYRVRPGDSLSTIAKKFGVSQGDLQRLNQIEDPRGIRMGQSLKIPG